MPVTIEQVAAAVSAAVGQSIAHVVQVHGSVANSDFVATAADARRFVLKSGPENEIAAEAWVCRHLAAQGVPVPSVIAVDSGGTRFGHPHLIMTFVAGQPSEHPGVFRTAGEWIRRVHDIELPGWGPLVTDLAGGGVAGRYRSWEEAIRAELMGLHELVRVGLLTRQVADAIVALVEINSILGYRGRGVLLHNDLKAAHIFGDVNDRNALTAIIDWGDARVSDPVADLARLSMVGSDAAAAFYAGYRIAITPELDDRLARYRLCWNASALSYEYRAGGDWFDVYRARILDDISLLSQ